MMDNPVIHSMHTAHKFGLGRSEEIVTESEIIKRAIPYLAASITHHFPSLRALDNQLLERFMDKMTPKSKMARGLKERYEQKMRNARPL